MSPARRILFVQQPNGGGSATGLVDLLRALDRSRIQPVVLCYQPNRFCERYREAGARVRVLEATESDVVRPLPARVGGAVEPLRSVHGLRAVNRLVRRDLPMARRIAGVIREEDPALVHHNDNPRGDRASILAGRMAGVPQVCHVRFLPEYFRPVDRLLGTCVDRFVFMSEAIARQYESAVGGSRGKGSVVYDPFDFEGFAENDARARREVRDELGIPVDAPVVSNVGRLVAWKGQDVFLRAVARLAAGHPDLRVLIVGGAGQGSEHRAYADALARTTIELGLEAVVTFTGFRTDVPRILGASDLIVHSSTQPEPFGRIVVEAMAAARPVVATDAGGVREIIESGRTGLLVPLGDAAAMAEAMERLLDDTQMARTLAEEGARSVRERFAADRFSEQLHAIYDTTLAAVR
ncbi:MAG: glycosyltransferase [Candidatus Palauibacterales bacterium]|nr:glycosyltransferase [Candidatus Palauibacterales bacterium]MDP2584495.1 glycosyltransferase [Candidatus Palauibacterales bacterium]